VALSFVPGTAGQQRLEDQFAELRPAGDHVAQFGAAEGQHLGRLDGDAGADRRLTGEDRDVADEGAGVGGGDVHVLARLALDELDPPALDHEEGRLADGVLVQDLAGLVGAPLAALLGEPPELGRGEPRIGELVGEVGEVVGAEDLGLGRRRHPIEATGSPNRLSWYACGHMIDTAPLESTRLPRLFPSQSGGLGL
jgi:hypothetical protein